MKYSLKALALACMLGVVSCGGGGSSGGGSSSSGGGGTAPINPTPTPIPNPTPTPAGLDECKQNLETLYAALLQYHAQNGQLPPDTCGSFWISIGNAGFISLSDPAYSCPVLGWGNPPGATDYTGPNGNANIWGPDDVIAADKVSNHGAGNPRHVLLRDGSVHLVTANSSLHFQASTQT